MNETLVPEWELVMPNISAKSDYVFTFPYEETKSYTCLAKHRMIILYKYLDADPFFLN